jgi:asparaginyl-tRNA synthetase
MPRIKEILSNKSVGENVVIEGWVRTRRDSKGISFIEVNDGSCLGNIQVIVDHNAIKEDTFLSATTGASISVNGVIKESPAKGQAIEVEAKDITVHGVADPETFPLQKKRHTNEFLRTIAHLRPRTNTFGAVFRVRSALSFAVHSFFTERGFVNLHSPIITGSDCEGAGAMFQVTTLPLDNVPKGDKGAISYDKDFFSKPTYLTVSGQLEGELFALALKNIYTFGPTFRAENSNTPRHLAEFWMIEPEMAFCDLRGNADIAEAFLKYTISYVLKNCAEDLEFFDKWIEPGIIKSLDSVANSDFQRMTYTEAVKVLENSGKKFEFPCSWGSDLQTEHERFLAEEYVKGPVFLTNYPKEIKAFYMRLDEGEKTVSAMDLLVPRLGEIIGGSQREERLEILERRILDFNLPIDHYQWYLDTRRFGTVPHAGFGLGFERLVMYVTGMQNIRDSIPFPRTPGHAEF